MNLKLTAQEKKLLWDKDLAVLHQESREWLNLIAFWKDEARFFADLLQKKQIHASEYGQMLHYSDKIHINLFDYLAEEIAEHERLMPILEEENKGLSLEEYKEKHHILREQMGVFTSDFMEFKKMIFGYAKEF